MSIGKNSLARAAAVVSSVPAAAETVAPVAGCQQVAVAAITAATGDKLPARAPGALTASVAQHGVLEPLVLAQTAPGELVLLAGAQRLAAAKKAGLTTVPAVIRELAGAEAAALRKEIKAFAAPVKKAEKAEKAPLPAASTLVGQAMPDWLL